MKKKSDTGIHQRALDLGTEGPGDRVGRFRLSNRRYIGCKQKLLDWIFEHVEKFAPDAKSFFDVFSGTGVVAERALSCDRFNTTISFSVRSVLRETRVMFPFAPDFRNFLFDA